MSQQNDSAVAERVRSTGSPFGPSPSHTQTASKRKGSSSGKRSPSLSSSTSTSENNDDNEKKSSSSSSSRASSSTRGSGSSKSSSDDDDDDDDSSHMSQEISSIHTHYFKHELSSELSAKDAAVRAKAIFESLASKSGERSEGQIHGDALYVGRGGIALAMLHFGGEHGLEAGREVLKKCLSRALGSSATKKDHSFLEGRLGIYCLALAHLDLPSAEIEQIVAGIENMRAVALEDASGDECLYGRGGYLFGLLFVLTNSNVKISQAQREMLEKTGRDVTLAIWRSGRHYRHSASPLMYAWHNSEYLGAVHGLAGILLMLMQAMETLSGFGGDRDRINQDIIGSLEFLAEQRYPSGNLRSSMGSNHDKLVQLCHGASGLVLCMAYAATYLRRFPEKVEKFRAVATEAGDHVFHHGLLRKDPGSLCHGISGNALTFITLFRLTRNDMWLSRARLFAKAAVSAYVREHSRVGDRSLSLFEGQAGLLVLMSALSERNSNTRHFEKLRFPGFEL